MLLFIDIVLGDWSMMISVDVLGASKPQLSSLVVSQEYLMAFLALAQLFFLLESFFTMIVSSDGGHLESWGASIIVFMMQFD